MLFFCGDNDEAGQKFNQYALEAALTLGLGNFRPQLRSLRIPKEVNLLPGGIYKRKDINDYLCEGRLEEILSENEGKKKTINWEAAIANVEKIFGKVEVLE